MGLDLFKNEILTSPNVAGSSARFPVCDFSPLQSKVRGQPWPPSLDMLFSFLSADTGCFGPFFFLSTFALQAQGLKNIVLCHCGSRSCCDKTCAKYEANCF